MILHFPNSDNKALVELPSLPALKADPPLFRGFSLRECENGRLEIVLSVAGTEMTNIPLASYQERTSAEKDMNRLLRQLSMSEKEQIVR